MWTCPNTLPPEATVQCLINPISYNWDFHLIGQIFWQFGVTRSKPFPCGRAPIDRLIWYWPKDGLYEVKSGYHFARMHQQNLDSPSSSLTTLEILWQKVWQLNIPPKVKHFAWQTISNTLPIKSNLLKRGMDMDEACSTYGSQVENVEHILRDCNWSSRLWLLCPLGFYVDTFTGLNFASCLLVRFFLRVLKL